MKFLDAAYYGDINSWNLAMSHEGADDFAYYVGGNIALHAWNGADVIALRSGSRRGMGIHVTTVVGRNGGADGNYFGRLNLDGYGASSGDRFCLDLEPNIYRAAPATATAYGVAWAAAVKAAGLSPVLYSTPDGCAAIGDKGFDAVWAAVPGSTDPNSIFASTYFPGMVAIQWSQNTFAGIQYDINTSEFLFSGDQMTPEEHDWLYFVYNEMANSALPSSQSLLDIWGATRNNTDAINAKVSNLQVPPANLNPIIAALKDIATAVTALQMDVKDIRSKVDKDLAS